MRTHAFVLAGLRAAACTAFLAASAAASATDAPPQQVPGYYRQALGELRITALFDGVVPLSRKELQGVSPERMDALLRRQFVPESDAGVQTAVNAYLVRTGGRQILVDAGTADCFGSDLGQVLRNLRSAGIAPEDVDTVLLTHAHPDHLCGLLDETGRMAYPNATVWLAEADAAYWLSEEQEAQASGGMRPLFGMARRAVAPYRDEGRLNLFAQGATLPAGVTALDSSGHTPGHTSYLFDGGDGRKLLVWGDIVHYHAVQFPRPEASYEYDVDRARAIATRRDLLERAAVQGWRVAGAHLPFPGLGHVRREGDGYAWVPAEFSPLQVP